MLMVAVKESSSPQIINDEAMREEAASVISEAIIGGIGEEQRAVFDGVVIDFEALRGAESRANFNAFLQTLTDDLDGHDKLLYVAVHPQRRDGQAYYDGYDYKAIGSMADKVILMAHDYNAKRLSESDMARGVTSTPLTPVEEIYYALYAVTDADLGVEDHSKIVLQLNLATAQWKLRDGAVTNSTPFTPYNSVLRSRVINGAEHCYSERYENPYIVFFNEEDQTDNIAWYENERSIAAKIELAKLFGISGLSIWRLGLIPDFEDTVINSSDAESGQAVHVSGWDVFHRILSYR